MPALASSDLEGPPKPETRDPRVQPRLVAGHRGAVDPEKLEKDPDGDYVLRLAKRKVGLRFFRDPQPETWMLELGPEASGSLSDRRLFLAVARFLAGAENEGIAPLAPGA